MVMADGLHENGDFDMTDADKFPDLSIAIYRMFIY
jgi:hypothetical protein